MSLRHRAGALIYDWPRWRRTAGRGRWVLMHNRAESIDTDGRGAHCRWRFTSELHIAKVYPSFGARLLAMSTRDWPIVLRDEPKPSDAPRVSFIIGHRGLERLPHLLMTLRSIAGQSADVECIVVEQSTSPQIESALPRWVRYLFTESRTDYNRAATFNAGVAAARGEVVILHDNDMLVPAAYASEVLDRVRDGAQFVDLKRFIFYLDEGETSLAPRRVSSVVQNLQGGSIAAVRSAYESIGGFDEEFVGWGGEDNDFWDRAATTGATYQFGYLPIVHLFHAPQPGKLQGAEAPAMKRYRELENVPAEERIRRLRGR